MTLWKVIQMAYTTINGKTVKTGSKSPSVKVTTKDHLHLERELVKLATPDNRKIYQRMLANPLFKVEAEVASDDGKYKFAVIMPDMTADVDNTDDAVYDDHLSIYDAAFGGVESQAFNLQNWLEHRTKAHFEQMGGPAPFEPFAGGAYRLGFLVRDDGDTMTISPLLDHGWSEQTYMFNPAYGNAVELESLPATIARSVLTAIPFSGFNPGRVEYMDKIFQQSWMRLTPVAQANWMSAYSSIYDFKLFIECSGKMLTSDQISRLWKVLD